MAEEGGRADERLIVMLEARIREFEKQMIAAERRGTRTYQRLQRGSRSATRQMEADIVRSTTRLNQALATASVRIGDFGRAMAAGMAGGVATAAITGLTSGLGRTIRALAEVGDEAKRAGVGLREFQEWKFVAEQNRIGVDQLTDGFKELNLRADEFVSTGGGSAAESFRRLGFSAAELAEGLKNPSELMLEIVGRLERMDSAAQIRISDELFGGSAGERFVELLDQGEAGLRRTIAQAHEVGAVIDSQMIEKAAELDRRWGALTTGVGNFFKSSAVGTASMLNDMIQFVSQLVNMRNELDYILGDEARARLLLGNATVDGLLANKAAVVETKAEIQQLDALYKQLAEAAYTAAVQMQASASTADLMGESELWEALVKGSNDLRDLADQFNDGKLSGEEFTAKLDDIHDAAEKAFAKLDEADEVHFGEAISQIDKLGDRIAAALGLAISLGRAIYDAAMADVPDAAAPPPTDFRSIPDDRREAILTHRRGVHEATGVARDRALKDAGRGGKGGGGGGSGRLDSLIGELQTERELLTAWYEESLALLNGATELELEALGTRHEAIERLEAEHKERLRQVDEQARSSELSAQQAMYGELTGLLNMFGQESKAAAVLAIGINTKLRMVEAKQNTAAAQMRAMAELGPIAGAAAAAKISAYGKIQMGLIAAAGAVQAGGGLSGGGGGGAAGVSGSSATAVAHAAPQDVILDLRSVDPALRALAQALAEPMIAQLQKASKNGVRIVAARY